MQHVYVVQIPLELPDSWYDLCRCLSIDAATAVVRALLAADPHGGYQLRVVVREEPYVPGA